MRGCEGCQEGTEAGVRVPGGPDGGVARWAWRGHGGRRLRRLKALRRVANRGAQRVLALKGSRWNR